MTRRLDITAMLTDPAFLAHACERLGAHSHEVTVDGETVGELGASLYLREVLGREDGAPPPVDLQLEKKTGDFVRDLIEAGELTVVHDLSDGGLIGAAASGTKKGDAAASPFSCPARPIALRR